MPLREEAMGHMTGHITMRIIMKWIYEQGEHGAFNILYDYIYEAYPDLYEQDVNMLARDLITDARKYRW